MFSFLVKKINVYFVKIRKFIQIYHSSGVKHTFGDSSFSNARIILDCVCRLQKYGSFYVCIHVCHGSDRDGKAGSTEGVGVGEEEGLNVEEPFGDSVPECSRDMVPVGL
jgi:hypothetical protein